MKFNISIHLKSCLHVRKVSWVYKCNNLDKCQQFNMMAHIMIRIVLSCIKIKLTQRYTQENKMPTFLTYIEKVRITKLSVQWSITNTSIGNTKEVRWHTVMSYKQILVNSSKRCILVLRQFNIPLEMPCQINYKTI